MHYNQITDMSYGHWRSFYTKYRAAVTEHHVPNRVNERMSFSVRQNGYMRYIPSLKKKIEKRKCLEMSIPTGRLLLCDSIYLNIMLPISRSFNVTVSWTKRMGLLIQMVKVVLLNAQRCSPVVPLPYM